MTSERTNTIMSHAKGGNSHVAQFGGLAKAAVAEGIEEDKASLIRAANWRYERAVVALQTEFYARQEALRHDFIEEIEAIGA
jgi:hypothetical protein